ncbi:MAG: Cysteine desulfurase SufS [Verrucomicrobia subdivision 3 bacterium]|nr:Cysteine desulfurase SufS [Limisphaerales bacterium]MCS1413072.1 Cysteine desulfurase SufS [Limisphaerales bacterium]
MPSIVELLKDESLRQSEFPVARKQVYLAHAGICPLPRRVADRMAGYLSASQSSDQETAAGSIVEDTRRSVADLLKVDPDEVALTGSTSNALSLVAAGFPFRAGDNVVIYRDDYPSNVYPWLALQAREVEVRSVEVSRLGCISVDDVLKQVDGRTRLVALASCHYLSGFRIDLDTIGWALHGRGIALCVDGIQSVGAFPTSLAQVDFMAADSRKWLLGPGAAGVLHVSEEWQDRLRPTGWGWNNLDCPGFVARDRLEFRPGARRYEAGTANLLGLVGLNTAVKLILDIGVSAIGAELNRKRAYLIEGARRAGYEPVVDEAAGAAWGGMLSITHPRRDIAGVFEILGKMKVRASLREVRSGQKYIRFSPHFYNTDAELDAALAGLSA